MGKHFLKNQRKLKMERNISQKVAEVEEAGDSQEPGEPEKEPIFCQLCRASFTSEIQLLLHFHEEHIISLRQKLDGTGAVPDFSFLSDESGSDLESEEDETGSRDDVEPDAIAGNFLTDYERSLLDKPVIYPFSESEDELDTESEDDEDDCEELLEFQMKDLSYNLTNGDVENEDGTDHENLPEELNDHSPSSPNELTSTQSSPARRILPARQCTRMSLSASVRDKRQLTLNLIPLLRSPGKAGQNLRNEKLVINQLKSSKTTSPKGQSPPKSFSMDHEDQVVRQKRKRKSFECTICGKTYTTNFRLKEHVAVTHNKEIRFECKHCKKGFYRESALNTHLLRHAGETPYECNVCRKGFTRPDRLQEHMITHTKETKFECEHCKRRFTTKPHLVRHIRLHTKETPYKCDICNHEFPRRDYLKYHMAKAHNLDKSSVVNRFSDADDKMGFDSPEKDQETVKKGKKSLFECTICGRVFARNQTLQEHVAVIHKKEKLFECEHCKKRFSRKSDMVRHVKLHTGDKPYRCDHCSHGFSNLVYLQHHITKVHNLDNSSVVSRCSDADDKMGFDPPEKLGALFSPKELTSTSATSRTLSVRNSKKKLCSPSGKPLGGHRRSGTACDEPLLSPKKTSKNPRTGNLGVNQFKPSKMTSPDGEDPKSFSNQNKLVDKDDQVAKVHNSGNSSVVSSCSDADDTMGFDPPEKLGALSSPKELTSTSTQSSPTKKTLPARNCTKMTISAIEKPAPSTLSGTACDKPLLSPKKTSKNQRTGKLAVNQFKPSKMTSPDGKGTKSFSNQKKLMDNDDQVAVQKWKRKSFECTICGKIFSRNYHFKEHVMAIHNKEKRFECEHCNKRFYRRRALTGHLLWHAKERPHKCDVCRKEFIRLHHLQEHMATHSKERPFECDQCWKRFISKSHLVRHEKVHTGEKRHKCDLCNLAFTRQDNLNRHIAQVHNSAKSSLKDDDKSC